jgi:hypothetical protein
MFSKFGTVLRASIVNGRECCNVEKFVALCYWQRICYGKTEVSSEAALAHTRNSTEPTYTQI